MSMNFKLINLMLINFKLINFMSINFKLINLMSVNFVNKQISYLFPLRRFLMLFGAYEILSQKVTFFHLNVFKWFLVLFGAFYAFLYL